MVPTLWFPSYLGRKPRRAAPRLATLRSFAGLLGEQRDTPLDISLVPNLVPCLGLERLTPPPCRRFLALVKDSENGTAGCRSRPRLLLQARGKDTRGLLTLGRFTENGCVCFAATCVAVRLFISINCGAIRVAAISAVYEHVLHRVPYLPMLSREKLDSDPWKTCVYSRDIKILVATVRRPAKKSVLSSGRTWAIISGQTPPSSNRVHQSRIYCSSEGQVWERKWAQRAPRTPTSSSHAGGIAGIAAKGSAFRSEMRGIAGSLIDFSR